MGLLGPVYKEGLSKKQMVLINCYRIAYLAVLLANGWAWGIRRRDFWLVITFVEALKTMYYTDDIDENKEYVQLEQMEMINVSNSYE